jgi:hypothetical protein
MFVMMPTVVTVGGNVLASGLRIPLGFDIFADREGILHDSTNTSDFLKPVKNACFLPKIDKN